MTKRASTSGRPAAGAAAESPAGRGRSGARSERILRATLEVIGEGGISAVTHRAVAAKADVPLGSMTYYFASKDDLLREALLLFVEEETVRLAALGEAMAGRDVSPEDVADAFADEIENHAHADRFLAVAQFELYLESARNEALQAAAERCFRAYEEVTEIALRVIGAADPARSAALFVALSDGLGLRRLATPGAEQPELKAALVDLVQSVALASAAKR